MKISSFVDGLLIGTITTILVYKIYWETRMLKTEKQNAKDIKEIIDKLLKNGNELPIEREEEK